MIANKAILVHPSYRGQLPPDYLQLKPEWFGHWRSIQDSSGLPANKLKEIRTFGILEKAYPLRDYLKKIDCLLEVEGVLIIQYYTAGEIFAGGHYIRPLSFLMHEISLSFSNRYRLVKKRTEGLMTYLTFRKIENFLADKDSMQRWTFGIVSDGRKDDRIEKIVDQIRAFKIPEYEILICGPKPKFLCAGDIKIISDADLYTDDIRIPITGKKNKIIDNASFSNLVIMHDRISFPDDWYQNMMKFGNFFEILANKIFDEDTHSRRVQDWMSYDEIFNSYTDVKKGYLKYDEWKPTVYVDGGFIIAKREVLKSVNGYNSSLHWGEAEDTDLSIRIYYAGFMTNVDINNLVYTQTHRHGGVDEKKFFKESSKMKNIYRGIKYKLRLKKQSKEFLQFIDNFSLDFQEGN